MGCKQPLAFPTAWERGPLNGEVVEDEFWLSILMTMFCTAMTKMPDIAVSLSSRYAQAQQPKLLSVPVAPTTRQQGRAPQSSARTKPGHSGLAETSPPPPEISLERR